MWKLFSQPYMAVAKPPFFKIKLAGFSSYSVQLFFSTAYLHE